MVDQKENHREILITKKSGLVRYIEIPSFNLILSTEIPEAQLEFLTYRYRVVLQLHSDCTSTFSPITTISENQMIRFLFTKPAQEFHLSNTGPEPQIAFHFLIIS